MTQIPAQATMETIGPLRYRITVVGGRGTVKQTRQYVMAGPDQNQLAMSAIDRFSRELSGPMHILTSI